MKLDREKLLTLFENHWKSKPHICESCGKYLGKENKTIFHDHLLDKSKYPNFAYELWNMYLVCLKCHDEKTRGFPSSKHTEAIEKAKQIANI